MGSLGEEEAMEPALRGAIAACQHCGASVERGPGAAEGPLWCCPGCEAAGQLVASLKLEGWYAERGAAAPRPAEALRLADGISAEPGPEGMATACFTVHGLRCVSCAWLVEQVLQRSPGVEEARTSITSGATTLRFRPAVMDLEGLLGRVAALGYSPRPAGASAPADHDLLLRLGVAAFCAANVMLLSAGLYAGCFEGMAEHHQRLLRLCSLALSTPVTLWSAAPFYARAWAGLKARVLHIDLPLSIAMIGMYAHGLWAWHSGAEAWLDSLTMLVALLLAGRFLEQRGRERSIEAATTLASRLPATARLLDVGGIRSVPAAELRPGQHVQIGAGEEVAADGVVLSGEGQLDQGLLTGESEPVALRRGASVHAGTVLLEGHVIIEVSRAGQETLVQRMAAELASAGPREERPDPLAPAFTLGTIAVAAAAAGISIGAGQEGSEAVARAVAVLVVACPCALALARPLCLAVGLGAAARRGLLLRGGAELLALARLRHLLLDKTGTLTLGAPVVVAAEDEVLRVAAGIERASIHPIARAIVAEAGARGIPIPLGQDIQEQPGVGISGLVDGQRRFLRSSGPGRVELVGMGEIELRDVPRPGAARVIAALRESGLEPAILTGDRAEVAEQIAAQLGIERVIAAANPERKLQVVRERVAASEPTLFVGDGINDGPALSAATLGLALASGAAGSVLAAGGVITGADLRPLLAGRYAGEAAASALARSRRRALAYNLIGVACAAAGLVSPLIAALLMPLSSGLVIATALGVGREVEARMSRWTP